MIYKWRIVNVSGRVGLLSQYTANGGHGAYYDSGGTARIQILLDGSEVFSFNDTNYYNDEIHALYGSLNISVPPDGVIDIILSLTYAPFDVVKNNGELEPPSGFTITNTGTPESEEGLESYNKYFWFDVASTGGDGGGGGSTGGGSAGPTTPASNQGTEYTVKSKHNVYATVTRWTYPPLFGVKLLTPPPPPPELFYPTTAGPNFTGSLPGMLLTPGEVYDLRDELGGYAKDMEVAGVKFKLSPDDIACDVAVGILPFKDA